VQKTKKLLGRTPSRSPEKLGGKTKKKKKGRKNVGGAEKHLCMNQQRGEKSTSPFK